MDDRTLAALAQTQHGLLARRQLAAAGLSRDQVMRARRAQLLHDVGSRTFALGRVPTGFEARVMAACLELDAVASHRSAARLHGLHGFSDPRRPDPIEVVVDRRVRHERHALARVHSTTHLPGDDLTQVAGIPTVGVARTFMMLAALVPEMPEERIVDALDVAMRDGQVSETWLRWRLDQLRCRGRNGIVRTEAILDARDAAAPESWLERRFLELLEAHSLPRPEVQVRIRDRDRGIARVDTAYPEWHVIMELDGHGAHSTAEQKAHDQARRNRLVLLGHSVLVFTHRHVVRAPDEVVAMVAEAVAPHARPAATAP